MKQDKRKRVIINADDFGLHEHVNEAVEIAHREGILTSASLVPNGPAFDDAVAIAKRNPRLGVGFHMNLIGERPVSSPTTVSSLLDTNGVLYENHKKVCLKILKGEILRPEIAREAEAQCRKLIESGITPTHIDSHRHLHLFPPVFSVIEPILKRYGITRMRYLNIPYFEVMRCGPSKTAMGLLLKSVSMMQWNRYRHPDYFFGIFESGNFRKEYLLHLLSRLKPGTTELNFHPGIHNETIGVRYNVWNAYFDWAFNWENELNVLIDRDVKDAVGIRDITLVNYGDIG